MELIRINLLPVRQGKKREAGRQILAAIAAVLIAAVVGNFLWYNSRSSERDRRQAQLTDTQGRIAELEQVIGEVNNINQRKKEVEDKLRVLSELRKGRSGPVRLLDALATATPKKVWLQNFDEKDNAVSMKGYAVSHEDVAEFMRDLGSVVWTPKGMGRVVEQKRDGKSVRVELLGADGAIEDLTPGAVGRFFTQVELKQAEQTEVRDGNGPAARRVNFEINLNTNYAL